MRATAATQPGAVRSASVTTKQSLYGTTVFYYVLFFVNCTLYKEATVIDTRNALQSYLILASAIEFALSTFLLRFLTDSVILSESFCKSSVGIWSEVGISVFYNK